MTDKDERLRGLVEDLSQSLTSMEKARAEITRPDLAEAADVILKALKATLEAARQKQKRREN